MKCECEQKGYVRSGIKGILACPLGGAGRLCIERCDSCERFDCDEAAAIYFATRRGGTLRYDARRKGRQMRIIWAP